MATHVNHRPSSSFWAGQCLMKGSVWTAAGIEPRMFSGPLGRTGLVFPRARLPAARNPIWTINRGRVMGREKTFCQVADWQDCVCLGVLAAITIVNTLVLRSQTEAMDAATLDCRSLEPPPAACPWKAGKGYYSTATMNHWPMALGGGMGAMGPVDLSSGTRTGGPNFQGAPFTP